MPSTILAAENLTHVFPTENGGLTALKEVSLSVAPHEFVSVVGPSGCGKSTLLKLLAGLLKPTSGRVLFDEQALAGPRRRIGLVFQKANLMPWRTVCENVSLPLELEGRPPSEVRARTCELVELVGLAGFEASYPQYLSGGMEQRVAIARALIHQPDVLLLDEPFGALDALTREQMGLALLRIWEASHPTIILVTHSISEAIFLADRVLALTPRPGRIRARIAVDFPRSRSLDITYTPEFGALAAQVRSAIG